ncbi:MAG: M12 family metallo-peptidase [Planctomycetota bacterium]|nr:M12 family metallo-peptidase [Planctomycetota bacterium]
MQREIKRGFCTRVISTCVIVWLLSGTALAQTSSSKSLIRSAGDRQGRQGVSGVLGAPDAAQRFEGVMRSRTIRLDVEALREVQVGQSIRLNLFESLDLEADITARFTSRQGATQWRGELRNVPGSLVMLAEVNGTVAGSIKAPGLDPIRIFSAGRGHYQLVQLNETKQLECGNDEALALVNQPIAGANARANAAPAGEITICDSGIVIDLLVVYSLEARELASGIPGGSSDAIEAEIALAELDINTILANSAIAPRVNVVSTLELSQPESSTFQTMLVRLTNIGDGWYEEAHAQRDAVGADVVCMLVGNTSLGGIAWIMSSPDPVFEAKAFNVNNWSVIAQSVLAHELGHNLGCCHDRQNCSGGIFEYSWGHRYTGDDNVLYRTTMSYRPGTRIKRFSNPNVTFAGFPTGEALTDNARTISETAPIVANYRQSLTLPRGGGVGTGITRLTPNDGLASDFFGISVAISGDVAVVGSSGHDDPVSDEGAAYVYRFDGIFWNIEQELNGLDRQPGDNFGASVAIEGDVIAVGATLTDDFGKNSGAVYVFRFEGLDWNFEQKLTADDDAASLDAFGTSIAISGNRIVVGAPFNNDDGPNSGSAYVFDYDVPTTTWSTLPIKLLASDATTNDYFGQSVGMAGDLIVVGAWFDDLDAITVNNGSTYVFRFDGVDWNEEDQFHSPFPVVDGYFGVSVDISEDIDNGDVIIVGAYNDDGISILGSPVGASGSAYIYRHDGLVWGFEDELPVPDEVIATGGGFGYAVSIDGVVAAVGAPFGDPSALMRYQHSAGVWTNTAFITNFLGEGSGISIDNDATLNGIISGAYLTNSFEGAADVFIGDSALQDCNGNGVSDTCDVLDGFSEDCNDNGIPDECDVDPIDGTSEDCNSNGIPDECDTPDGEIPDCDGNGENDLCEIAAGTAIDTNFDGIIDECQDCNSNGIPDPVDILGDPSLDCNLNGIIDACDIADGTSEDVDLDGVPDECGDCDNNGAPDYLDLLFGGQDLNGNNILDICEHDCNGNSIPDAWDIATGTSYDFNDDGVPDECEADCDNDGVSDELQIAQGIHEDCDGNDIPDFCDLRDGYLSDCEPNGIPDECQFAMGFSFDINNDGIPDECQDCNQNGVFDDEEIALEPRLDCNLNLVMDLCESPDINGNGMADFCEDCNGNLVPDHLDVSSGFSLDQNLNNLPDECERAGDVDSDGVVGVNDLLTLLASWGFCTETPCPGDLDYNGVVDVNDLLILLADWG